LPAQPSPYRRPGKNGWYARLAVPDGTKRSGYRYCVRSLRTEDAAEARRRFPGVYASLQEEFGLIQPRSRQRLREAAEEWFESVAEGADSLLDAVEQVSGEEVEQDSRTGEYNPTTVQRQIEAAVRRRDTKEIGPTWEEAIEAWKGRRLRAKGELSPSSVRSMELVVKELRNLKGSLEPAQLTEEKVWEWIRAQESLGKRPTTVRTKLSMLRALTKACFKVKLLKQDPLSEIEYEVAPGESYRSPTTDEYRRIWGNLDCLEDEDKTLFSLLMLTGMRLDEAASRFGGHIRSTEGVVTLEISELKGESPWKPKTKASARILPWPENLETPAASANQQLFQKCRYRNGKFGKTASQRIKQKLWRAAELPVDSTLTIHSLRAGYIDALRAVQCPLEIEEAIVGHAKAQSTVHRGYGNGYPIDVLKEWSGKAARLLVSYA
jgi:integrase